MISEYAMNEILDRAERIFLELNKLDSDELGAVKAAVDARLETVRKKTAVAERAKLIIAF